MAFRTTLPRKLEGLGIPVPAALAEVFALDVAVDEIRFAKPVDDLRSDVANGRLNDPTKLKARITKAAEALTAHERATAIAEELDHALEHRARVALVEGADEIVKHMQARFEQAAALLLAGLDALGPNPGPELGNQSSMLKRIYDGWRTALDDTRAIRSVIGKIDTEIPKVAWFLDQPTDIDSAVESFRDQEVWGLIRDGHAVRLNTRDEALALLAGVSKARSDAEAAAEAERKEAARLKAKPVVDGWNDYAKRVGEAATIREHEHQRALAEAQAAT